jgi:hypothetical protein
MTGIAAALVTAPERAPPDDAIADGNIWVRQPDSKPHHRSKIVRGRVDDKKKIGLLLEAFSHTN